jgi:starvation-inducible DNA-binding protein
VHQELSATATHSQISTADIANVASQADALYEARSATYPLVIKSHMYHWNVTGPHIRTVHELTETRYTDMIAAADVIAERIRALSKSAVIGPAQVSEGSRSRCFPICQRDAA